MTIFPRPTQPTSLEDKTPDLATVCRLANNQRCAEQVKKNLAKYGIKLGGDLVLKPQSDGIVHFAGGGSFRLHT